MQKDVCKAVYGEGPYILLPPYKQFIKEYEEWREMSKQEKYNRSKSFFNFVPSEADLNTCFIKHLEENQTNIDLRIEASVGQHELNPILHKEQQTTESLLNNDKDLLEWKKLPIVPSDLDIDNVPKTTISTTFSEAEPIMNEKGAITKAASTDERL